MKKKKDSKIKGLRHTAMIVDDPLADAPIPFTLYPAAIPQVNRSAAEVIAAGYTDAESNRTPVLTTDSEARKEIPLFSGVLNYFPLALAAVATLSKRGNDKHNPGQPIHWARDKSTDHLDCIARHLLDVGTVNSRGEYEDAVAIAWRALAHLQEVEEKRLGKPRSRGSR